MWFGSHKIIPLKIIKEYYETGVSQFVVFSIEAECNCSLTYVPQYIILVISNETKCLMYVEQNYKCINMYNRPIILYLT